MKVLITIREDPAADDGYEFTHEYIAVPYSAQQFNQAVQDVIRALEAQLPRKVYKVNRKGRNKATRCARGHTG